MNTNDPWGHIAGAVIAQLPDGIRARREVLLTLLKHAPIGSGAANDIRSALRTLDEHLIRQSELSLGLTDEGSHLRGSPRLGERPLARGSSRLGDGNLKR